MVDRAIENRVGERPTTAGRHLVLPSDREGIGQWWPPSWGGGTWAPESLKSQSRGSYDFMFCSRDNITWKHT